MNKQNDSVVYKRADIEGNALGDEMVFFDGRAGKYFATGPVGAEIWQLLAAPASIDTITAHLCETYEVDIDVCRNQTTQFIEQMLRAGLIIVA